MGETCVHVPARVLGFTEANTELVVQQRGPGSAQLEQRASLLSALLKESSSRPMPMPSTYMETSETDSDEEHDDAMEEQEDEDEDVNCGEWRADGSGSAPVPIPSTSEAFLKSQREALKRFVYAHQIEEMRRQCAQYFARQGRFNSEGRATNNAMAGLRPAQTVPVEPAGAAARAPLPQAAQHLPGF